jgi:hypothetical protein
MNKEDNGTPLDNLMCQLNRVTSHWRHLREVSPKYMDALCNAQIDAEKYLKEKHQAEAKSGE